MAAESRAVDALAAANPTGDEAPQQPSSRDPLGGGGSAEPPPGSGQHSRRASDAKPPAAGRPTPSPAPASSRMETPCDRDGAGTPNAFKRLVNRLLDDLEEEEERAEDLRFKRQEQLYRLRPSTPAEATPVDQFGRRAVDLSSLAAQLAAAEERTDSKLRMLKDEIGELEDLVSLIQNNPPSEDDDGKPPSEDQQGTTHSAAFQRRRNSSGVPATFAEFSVDQRSSGRLQTSQSAAAPTACTRSEWQQFDSMLSKVEDDMKRLGTIAADEFLDEKATTHSGSLVGEGGNKSNGQWAWQRSVDSEMEFKMEYLLAEGSLVGAMSGAKSAPPGTKPLEAQQAAAATTSDGHAASDPPIDVGSASPDVVLSNNTSDNSDVALAAGAAAVSPETDLSI